MTDARTRIRRDQRVSACAHTAACTLAEYHHQCACEFACMLFRACRSHLFQRRVVAALITAATKSSAHAHKRPYNVIINKRHGTYVFTHEMCVVCVYAPSRAHLSTRHTCQTHTHIYDERESLNIIQNALHYRGQKRDRPPNCPHAHTHYAVYVCVCLCLSACAWLRHRVPVKT